MKLSDYLTKMGHGSGTALALFLGVAQSNVSDWAKGKKLTPAGRCRAIEQWASGEVTVMELRPDDWKEYWPERAQAQATPAKPAIETVAQASAALHEATLEIKHAAEALCQKNQPWDGVERRGVPRLAVNPTTGNLT